jgi:hypothetical protein
MKSIRLVLLAALLSISCLEVGCANGGSSDYYQRGPTQHYDSFPGHARHGPGYSRYGRPRSYRRY